MNLKAGKILYDILKSTEVAANFSKIAPLVVEKTTPYPFCVYKRIGNTEENTKDMAYEDRTVIEVKVVSDKYMQGLDLAQRVAEQLPRRNVATEDAFISSLALTDVDEDYMNNAFVQTLSFTLVTNKI